jgi:type III secretion protein V
MRALRASAGEIALAIVVVAVVVLMVAPVYPTVLDVVIAVTLALGVVLLMASLTVLSPVRLGTFPALVLVSTLLRLGLVVAVTRGILVAEPDGGRIVETFGKKVAADDVLIGLVVFAVIAIFQFVVIARGAEREAEVAARFALDAMPGKQMAIDADLRAGSIDAAEAARRRGGLEREAQFYGAMDGAMKFVKGDAIAALLVVVVVLLAGLAVGVVSRNLTLSAAVDTYAVLAIGAGLAVQLPALLVALAAALLVTRVASEREGGLGEDVGAQLLAEPRALAAAAVLLAAVAFVLPGALVSFLALAIVAGVSAVIVARRVSRAGRPPDGALAVAGGAVRTDIAPPVSVELGAALLADVGGAEAIRAAGARARAADGGAGGGGARVDGVIARLDDVRQALFDDLGVRVPPIAVRANASLRERELGLALDGVIVDYAEVPTRGTGGGAAGAADGVDTVVAAAERALRRVAHELVTIDAVQARLDELAATHPAAVREVVPRIASLPVLVEVLRQLVREQVSIRDLAAVLGGLAAQQAPAGGFGASDASALAERVRATLQRHITAAHAPRGELAAYTVDAMIEDALRGAVVQRDGAPVLALEPDLARDIVAAARSALPKDAPSVVLASGDVRRHLRALLAPEMPDVAVLAPHELGAGVTVRAAGRITV